VRFNQCAFVVNLGGKLDWVTGVSEERRELARTVLIFSCCIGSGELNSNLTTHKGIVLSARLLEGFYPPV